MVLHPFSLPLPSELLEDLEGSSSAGGIAECFVQRVRQGPGLGPGEVGWGGVGREQVWSRRWGRGHEELGTGLPDSLVAHRVRILTSTRCTA